MSDVAHQDVVPSPNTRKRRADAKRNVDAILVAAKEVFATGGIDAPVRDIAERAGVGVGTLYRHFPRRPDLIAAVFYAEINACADAADRLEQELAPFAALKAWMAMFVDLALTKRGFAQVLHSGDPAFDTLPAKRDLRLFPAFRRLFERARIAGAIRADIDADAVLNAAAVLCLPGAGGVADHAQGMVRLLVDGLRSLHSE